MPLNGALVSARHPFIRHREYERRVERRRHGFVVFRSSVEKGAGRSAGPDPGARDAASALLITLERHGCLRRWSKAFGLCTRLSSEAGLSPANG